MAVVGRLLLALIALAFACAAAPARPLTEAETAALAERVESFDAAMRSGDFETIVGIVPPRVMAHIAESADMTVESLRQILVQQTQEAMAAVKIESFGMDLSEAEHRELPDGEPYVLIPTETVIDIGDKGRMRAKSHTLALLDEGAWYLVRVSEAQQVMIMRQVYPGFVGVEFPAGSMEALD